MSAHPLTNDPTMAWKELSKTQTVIDIDINSLKKSEESIATVRVVCMSDTHSYTSKIKFDIPDGDIFIHAGDFTYNGLIKEVQEFNRWIGNLPHKHKIVIAGNHEFSFDPIYIKNKEFAELVKSYLTNCIYLEDSMTTINGIQIYGSPWQPIYIESAFNLNRGEEILSKWKLIPPNIDILVTHGPPIGHGDLSKLGLRAGCVELLTTIQKHVHPKYHVFGHIHEGYGVTTDGKTIFINASTCNIEYIPNNLPIVFDISSSNSKECGTI